ncbi:MAG: hypothetical protein K2N05_11430 [Muribaculaceae bacterium]|nr:hypothetical protein [Muribaculaceae bacterium]
MNLFRDIFSQESSWTLKRNEETGLVDGVRGRGNSIFTSIIDSINKYLGNNSGSVIDFNLLKDAIDRHCDSVENDISTQTPIPLYWGLAGTMAGVIIGLWDLLNSNAIMILMGSDVNNIATSSKSAATGIDALLSGVAWAMVASICGIVLTTVNSILFKKCKLKEESGKNSFLAWMQAELLPELPSDTSQALNNLVKNLNKFNTTFADNTTNLRDALTVVNESYAIQADVIKAVHDMDVMKMAQANIDVLRELQNSTDKLEEFNLYLMGIKGYTDEIHRFEQLFAASARKYEVLEEIRDFFRRHKGEIARSTADADVMLQEALTNIKDSTQSNVNELHKNFVTQSEEFKRILNSEKEAFEEFITKMNAQFSAQMSHMPTLQRQLEEISSIPSRLDKLAEKIDKSNAKLLAGISDSLKNSKTSTPVFVGGGNGETPSNASSTPGWMRFTGWIAIIIIALACIFNVGHTVFASPEAEEVTEPSDSIVYDPVEVVEEIKDSIVAGAPEVAASTVTNVDTVKKSDDIIPKNR